MHAELITLLHIPDQLPEMVGFNLVPLFAVWVTPAMRPYIAGEAWTAHRGVHVSQNGWLADRLLRIQLGGTLSKHLISDGPTGPLLAKNSP
jgi:hypothetical protein